MNTNVKNKDAKSTAELLEIGYEVGDDDIDINGTFNGDRYFHVSIYKCSNSCAYLELSGIDSLSNTCYKQAKDYTEFERLMDLCLTKISLVISKNREKAGFYRSRYLTISTTTSSGHEYKDAQIKYLDEISLIPPNSLHNMNSNNMVSLWIIDMIKFIEESVDNVVEYFEKIDYEGYGNYYYTGNSSFDPAHTE